MYALGERSKPDAPADALTSRRCAFAATRIPRGAARLSPTFDSATSSFTPSKYRHFSVISRLLRRRFDYRMATVFLVSEVAKRQRACDES